MRPKAGQTWPGSIFHMQVAPCEPVEGLLQLQSPLIPGNLPSLWTSNFSVGQNRIPVAKVADGLPIHRQ